VPIDEPHPVVPPDSYAMSKVCNETIARSFHARTDTDSYGLRISSVFEPDEYADRFPALSEIQPCAAGIHSPVSMLAIWGTWFVAA
jgi:nucleoside-diphosphate-sugar epimerase